MWPSEFVAVSVYVGTEMKMGNLGVLNIFVCGNI
jgi:hypothetical protein